MILVIDNYDSFTWNLVQYLQELAEARAGVCGDGSDEAPGAVRGDCQDEPDEIVEEPVEIRVRRNDELSVAEALAMRPAGIVISPGPCTPDEAGISLELVRAVAGLASDSNKDERDQTTEMDLARGGQGRAPGGSAKGARSGGSAPPLLGVCLGHQCIAQAFGGRIVRAPEIVHGKASTIRHGGGGGGGILAGLTQPFEATRYHSLVVEESSLPACLEVTAWTELPEPPGLAAERPRRLIMGIAHRELPIHGVQFHPESILTTEGKALMANFLEMACGPVREVSEAGAASAAAAGDARK